MREEFLTRIAQEIFENENNDDDEDNFSRDENNDDSKKAGIRFNKIQQQVNKMFAVFEEENNPFVLAQSSTTTTSLSEKALAIRNVSGEATFMLAVNSLKSDKLLITLWE